MVVLPICGPEHRFELGLVVAAEVREETRQLVVRHIRDDSGEGIAVAGRGGLDETRAGLGPGSPDEDLVVLVGHLVDPFAQRLAARHREALAEPTAVLRLDRMPAGRREHVLHPPDPDTRDHTIQALAIEVHDHGHVAQTTQGVLQDRLPDVALVELCVAHECHKSAVRLLGDSVVEMETQIAVRQRGEQRGHGPQSHGASREVDRVRVLGPRRVRLETAELAQTRQHRAVQIAEDVLEGVVGGRGVRFDRNQVAGAEPAEVQRGQDGHDRRT